MQIGKAEINNEVGKRDAFHVPCVLVQITEEMNPGENVRFTNNAFTAVVKSDAANRHAILDPFIKEINIGDLCWALLIPDVTANLMHHFEININDVPEVPAPMKDDPEEIVEEEIDEDDYDNSCKGCW